MNIIFAGSLKKVIWFRQFHKSAATYDKWPIYKGVNFMGFTTVLVLVLVVLVVVVVVVVAVVLVVVVVILPVFFSL
jgi:hypothetical protein